MDIFEQMANEIKTSINPNGTITFEEAVRHLEAVGAYENSGASNERV